MIVLAPVNLRVPDRAVEVPQLLYVRAVRRRVAIPVVEQAVTLHVVDAIMNVPIIAKRLVAKDVRIHVRSHVLMPVRTLVRIRANLLVPHLVRVLVRENRLQVQ